MTNELAACVLKGLEADLDGVCVEHGETACVVYVQLGALAHPCEIPGFQCTEGHDAPPAT